MQVVINGNTYTDGIDSEGGTVRNLGNGGHRTYFIPLIQDVVTVADGVQTNATQVAADAATVAADKATVQALASGISVATTSASTQTIGSSGTKTFTLAAAISLAVNQLVLAVDSGTPTNLMYGIVTAWNSGTKVLAFTALASGGSGSHSSWNVSICGMQGPTGATGASGAGSGDMLAAQNLNDVANKSTSRTNLGVAIGVDVQAYDANTTKNNVANSFTAAQNFSDNLVTRASFKDTSARTKSLGNISGAVAIDYTEGHLQYGTVNNNISGITVSNWPPTGDLGTLTIEITQDGTGGRTLALGAAYKTVGGAGITLTTTAGAVDKLRLETRDAGTTIHAFLNADIK